MKRKIHSVLRSRTGASITFALLLFLVCSVVGCIALTAGTAAAGRVSNLAEMDQRYYSVTSAAKLLASELNGKTVKIERTREITTVKTTPYTVTEQNFGGVTRTVVTEGTSVESSSAVYNTIVNDDDAMSAEFTLDEYDDISSVTASGSDTDDWHMSFLTARAVELLFSGTCNTDEAMDMSIKNGHAHTGTITLTHNGSGIDADALEVEGNYNVREDGTLVLTLQNTGGAHYTVRVFLKPSIVEKATENSSDAVDRTYTESGYSETVTTVKTLEKTSEITWIFSGIEKVVS